jgi:ankyrin repeat protein
MSVLGAVEDTMRTALSRRSLSGHLDWLTVGCVAQSRHAGAVLAGGRVRAPCRRTCLHVAVSEDKADYIRLLVARGADVSAKCGLGLTPLVLAVVRGHGAAAAALLEVGAGGSREELAACVCIGRYLGHARIVAAVLAAKHDAAMLLGDDVAAEQQPEASSSSSSSSSSPPPPPPTLFRPLPSP